METQNLCASLLHVGVSIECNNGQGVKKFYYISSQKNLFLVFLVMNMMMGSWTNMNVYRIKCVSRHWVPMRFSEPKPHVIFVGKDFTTALLRWKRPSLAGFYVLHFEVYICSYRRSGPSQSGVYYSPHSYYAYRSIFQLKLLKVEIVSLCVPGSSGIAASRVHV